MLVHIAHHWSYVWRVDRVEQNTGRRANVSLMLVQRRQRWTNFKLTLALRIAGDVPSSLTFTSGSDDLWPDR